MTPTQMLAAIAATQAACPSDGDRSESVSAPDERVMANSDAEAQVEVAIERGERQRWGGAA